MTTQVFSDVNRETVVCDYGHGVIDLVEEAQKRGLRCMVLESENLENWILRPLGLKGKQMFKVCPRTFHDGVPTATVFRQAGHAGSFLDPFAALVYANNQRSRDTYVTFFYVHGVHCAFVINCAERTIRKSAVDKTANWYGNVVFLYQLT